MHRSRAAAGDRPQELERALDGTRLLRRIHAALEALAGIGRESDAPRPSHDRRRRKIRRLEKHVLGRGAHRGALPSHDAGEPHGPDSIGDEEHVAVGGDLPAVEERQPLAALRQAHLDTALELR